MDQLVCIEDYENYALNNLPSVVKDYYKNGAGEQYTTKLNREAFRKYRIRPRVLKNVSQRDISTTILGEKVSMPLGVAPTAMQRMAHPDGECANAKAAQEVGTIFILSTISTSSIEEVAKAAPNGIKWFQLYVYVDRNVTFNLVKRAEKAGFKALVLTVDAPMFGNRRSDIRNKFTLPSHLKLANFDGMLSDRINAMKDGSALCEYVSNLFDDTLSWKDVTWLKSITHLPIVLKGVLTPEDAILGVQYGVSAILVSNHGGRQIDGTPATIEVLSEIAEAVGDKVEVYMDGGITQGTDVLKALALGAKMTFVGRPLLWGLANGGKEGAKAVLNILKTEIDHALALAGCRTVKDIAKNMVIHEAYYSRI